MSAAIVERRAPCSAAASRRRGVALSEWTKLWCVRSTRWSLLAAFLFTIGLARPRVRGRRPPLPAA